MLTIKEKTEWELAPENDVIMNRFDLIGDGDRLLLAVRIDDREYEIPVCLEKETARFGLWLSQTPPEAVVRAAEHVFDRNRQIKTITYQHYLHDLCSRQGVSVERNHWSILFPETPGQLDDRLSAKKRYNIRREKRIAAEQIGAYEIVSYPAAEVPREIVALYFEYKKAGYGMDYRMEPEAYLEKFHVSHVYVLKFIQTGHIGAIVCSCEQGQNVYLENLTYDPAYQKYSLGAILYDEYLKILIQKNKRSLYLGYGQKGYKSLYGAQETTTYSGTLYRSKARYLKEAWLPEQTKRGVRTLKNTLKKLDVLNVRRILR